MTFQQINWNRLLYCNRVVYRLPRGLGTCVPSAPSHLSKHLEARRGGRTLNITSRVVDEGEALSTRTN